MCLDSEEQGNEEKTPTSTTMDTDGREPTGTLPLTLPTFIEVDLVLTKRHL